MPAREPWRVRSPDGTPVGVHSRGEGSPIVLVHGTACDHRVFARVARRLAKRYAVHAIDRRGRGASGDADAYALEREVEDVAAVCQAVRDDAGRPVAVVGHSLGGILALEAAVGTDAIGPLVVYEPPIHGADEPATGTANELTALLDEQGPQACVRAFLAAVGYRERDLARLQRDAATWEATVATAATIPREVRADLAYRLDPFQAARVDTPVLCLVGSQSPPAFRRAAARLRANLSNARVEVLEGAGHGVLFEAPGRFVDVVERFLDACEA